MDQDADKALEELETWLGTVMDRLKPGERQRLARRIGQLMCRRNAARIRRNVEPDGNAMEKRKPRRANRSRLRDRHPAKGRMFRKLGTARQLKVTPDPDGVEITFRPKVAGTAKRHHFGLIGFVDKTSAGREIRTRYPVRRLLGLSREDRDMILEESLGALD